jgi:hypothetical protein
MWVSEGIAVPHRQDRRLGPDGPEERLRAGAARPVVRNLDHLCAERDTGVEERRLAVPFEIPREQNRLILQTHAEDQRPVIGPRLPRRASARRHAFRTGMQHLDDGIPHPDRCVTRNYHPVWDAPPSEVLLDPQVGRRKRRPGPGPDFAHGERAEDRRGAADVIGLRMR